MNIRFEGEEGVGGGIKREYFKIISQELLNPNYCLFIDTPNLSFQPNPRSYINPGNSFPMLPIITLKSY